MTRYDPGFWSRDHSVVGIGSADSIERLLVRLGFESRPHRLVEYLARECDLCSLGRSEESALAVLVTRGFRTFDSVRVFEGDPVLLGRFREAYRLYLRCADALAGLMTYVLCPFCLSDRVAGYGSAGGRKQFKCSSCGKYFTRVPTWSYSKHSLYIPEVLRLYSFSRSGGGRWTKDRVIEGRILASRKAVLYAEKVGNMFRLATQADKVEVVAVERFGRGLKLVIELDVALPRSGDSLTSVALYSRGSRAGDLGEVAARACLLDVPLRPVEGLRFRGRVAVLLDALKEVEKKVALVSTFRIRRPHVSLVEV